MGTHRFGFGFLLGPVCVLLGAVAMAIAWAYYRADPAHFHGAIVFTIHSLQMAIMASGLALIPEAWPHWVKAWRSLTGRAKDESISISITLFAIFVAGFTAMLVLGFWRRMFDHVLIFINPELDPSPAGKVTGIFAAIAIFACIWWLHAVARGVTGYTMREWRVEHLRMSIILTAAITLTALGV